MYNKKTFLLLFLLMILVGTVSAVSASELANNTVGESDFDKIEVSENDNVIGVEEDGEIMEASDESDVLKDDVQWGTFTELQKIIDDVPDGVTITLYSHYYCDDEFTRSGIVIDKPITIDAQGRTWDACYKSSVLLIFSDDVVIKNLNLINGYDANDVGAGAFVRSSQTTFEHCNFINNTAVKGGAIDVTGNLILRDCIFYNNLALEDGGAIYAHYPVYGDTSLDISDSVFWYNGVKGNGGAIYLDSFRTDDSYVSGAAKSTIKNTIFNNNGAMGYGGAIFNFQNLDIQDSDFVRNNAKEGGGAIYMNNGITNSEGTVTQTFRLNIHGTTNFQYNTAGRYGGAIKIYADPTPLAKGIKGILNVYDNVLFDSNGAKTGGALSIIDSNSNVREAFFRNNQAEKGSAVEGGKVVNCKFEGNSGTATSGTSLSSDVKPQITIKQSGTYYPDKKLTITLKDSVTGKVLPNQIVTIVVGGKTVSLRVNSNGAVTYKLPFAGTSTATVSFVGTGIKYSASQKVTVKKATPKITASKKTFNVKLKTKSYAATFKVNNKALKNVKVTLKVNGKTYSAKTNSNGKATFKITKLTKKGGFNAVINFAGNSYYNKASKTVKITAK
ncbi:hypothetical protein [Methanobrevibacter sp.]